MEFSRGEDGALSDECIEDCLLCNMGPGAEGIYSPAVSNGDTIGDGAISPLGILDFVMRRGDGGGGGYLPGDC